MNFSFLDAGLEVKDVRSVYDVSEVEFSHAVGYRDFSQFGFDDTLMSLCSGLDVGHALNISFETVWFMVAQLFHLFLDPVLAAIQGKNPVNYGCLSSDYLANVIKGRAEVIVQVG